MQCEEVDEKILEYVSGELQGPALAQFEEHLRGCEACRNEAEASMMLWIDLEKIPTGEPSPDARAQFDRMLKAYKQELEQAQSVKAMPEAEKPDRFEQQVLTAMLTLGPEADFNAIQDKLRRMTGNRVGLDALFTALDRLEQKGLLQSRQSETKNPLRDRPKRLYCIDAAGLRALQETLESAKRLKQILEENGGSVPKWITNFAKKRLQD